MSSSSRSIREEYDRLAPFYERQWARYIDATLRATIDGLELRPGDRVLDVGTGTGELPRRLLCRWPGLEVIGLDLSRPMLLEGSGKARWLPVQADAGRLPLADASFDAVLCTSALHMFPSPRAALAEMRRVLRMDGVLILTDWCDDYLTCKLCSLWLSLTDPAFHQAYTLDQCRGMLIEAGFRVESAQRFKIDWLWGLMRLVGVAPGPGPG